MNSIVKGSAINLATRFGAVLLGLAITLVVARLGTAEQGAFALFTAVEGVLLALGSGFGVAVARRISHHRERPRGLVSASLLACGALGLAVALGLAAVAMQAQQGPYALLMLLAFVAPLMFIAPNVSGIWLGQGHMVALAVFTLAAPALVLFGIGIGSFGGAAALALPAVLVAWITARALVALASLWAARHSGWLGAPDAAALKREATFVAVIGVTNLIGLLNYKVDLFLVERFLGLPATGVYSIAVLVAELLWLVSSSVTTAAYARIGAPEAQESARLTVRALHANVLLLALSAPLLWLLAALLVPWLLGDAYRGALPVLALLLPGVAVYGAASALSAWFTNHAGRPWVPALLAGASLVINISVSLIAIPRFGALGAALGTSVSYVATVLIGAGWFARASGMPIGALLRPDWRSLVADLRRLWPASGLR